METNKFLKIVQETAGLKNTHEAKIATQVVFNLLHHRITEDEAEDVKSQLPKDLADIWEGGPSWFQKIFARYSPHNTFNQIEFLQEVDMRKGDIVQTADRMTKAVFYALQLQISPGESKDIEAQLPKGLKELWKDSRPLMPHSGYAQTQNVSISREYSKGPMAINEGTPGYIGGEKP